MSVTQSALIGHPASLAVRRGARTLPGIALVAGLLMGGLIVMGGMIGGCGKEEAPPPPAEVKTVEAYGITLDPAATPQQVAYVLLRSIADDYAAARAKDAQAQRKAQLVTYSLAAPKIMEERLLQTINHLNPDVKKTSLGAERDDRLSKTAHYWGPIIAHYLPSFANADLQTVIRDSWVAINPDGRRCQVYYPVSHDPAGDPAKTETATIDIELYREAAQAGGPEYWRVASVRFLGRQILQPPQPLTVQADGMTLDDSATPEQVASAMLKTLAQAVRAHASRAKDAYISAIYRAYCLSYPALVQARSAADSQPADANALALAVKTWRERIAPSASAIQANAVPGSMHAVNNSDGTADVTFASAEAGSTITVQLAKQISVNKTFWRVVDVEAQSTQAPVGTTAPAPAMAPAGAPGN